MGLIAILIAVLSVIAITYPLQMAHRDWQICFDAISGPLGAPRGLADLTLGQQISEFFRAINPLTAYFAVLVGLGFAPFVLGASKAPTLRSRFVWLLGLVAACSLGIWVSGRLDASIWHDCDRKGAEVGALVIPLLVCMMSGVFAGITFLIGKAIRKSRAG
ncbi:hypothetical protein [Hyphomonas oceanitis]|uniref:hypothetical protein n=1 Tax=Hyphomonas oceanitis TaxID=81033 RepID=UPI0030036861